MVGIEIEDENCEKTIGEGEDVLEEGRGQRLERQDAEEPVEDEQGQQGQARPNRWPKATDARPVE